MNPFSLSVFPINLNSLWKFKKNKSLVPKNNFLLDMCISTGTLFFIFSVKMSDQHSYN